MLTQMEHAEGGVLGKHSHDNNVAALLDGLHKRADRRFNACHLEAHLITLVAKQLFGHLFKRTLGDVERVGDATLAGLGQSQVADIGDEHTLGTTRFAELCHEVADGSCTAHHHVLAFHVGAVAGMCAHRCWLNHGAEVEAHALWQLKHAVVVDNEIVLCAAVGLECLYAKVLAHVILSALARVTLAAHQLGACRYVVARLAHRDLAAASHDDSRIFVSLNHRVEGCGMESVIRVYLAAADAYALYVDENLMLFEVFSLGGWNRWQRRPVD